MGCGPTLLSSRMHCPERSSCSSRPQATHATRMLPSCSTGSCCASWTMRWRGSCGERPPLCLAGSVGGGGGNAGGGNAGGIFIPPMFCKCTILARQHGDRVKLSSSAVTQLPLVLREILQEHAALLGGDHSTICTVHCSAFPTEGAHIAGESPCLCASAVLQHPNGQSFELNAEPGCNSAPGSRPGARGRLVVAGGKLRACRGSGTGFPV